MHAVPPHSQTDSQTIKAGSTGAEPFDAVGYYFPTEEVVFGEYHFQWITINDIAASIRLVSTANEAVFVSVDCPHPLVRPDTLDLRCPGSPIGDLAISGAFVDKRGTFWNRSDLGPRTSIVLRAAVTADSVDRKVLRHVEFTYSRGD